MEFTKQEIQERVNDRVEEIRVEENSRRLEMEVKVRGIEEKLNDKIYCKTAGLEKRIDGMEGEMRRKCNEITGQLEVIKNTNEKCNDEMLEELKNEIKTNLDKNKAEVDKFKRNMDARVGDQVIITGETDPI